MSEVLPEDRQLSRGQTRAPGLLSETRRGDHYFRNRESFFRIRSSDPTQRLSRGGRGDDRTPEGCHPQRLGIRHETHSVEVATKRVAWEEVATGKQVVE